MNRNQLLGFSHELDKIAFELDHHLLPTLLGGLGGGAIGYHTTDDPRKKRRNALIGALLGGTGGYMITDPIKESLEGPRPSKGQRALAKFMRRSWTPQPKSSLETLRDLGRAGVPNRRGPLLDIPEASRENIEALRSHYREGTEMLDPARALQLRRHYRGGTEAAYRDNFPRLARRVFGPSAEEMIAAKEVPVKGAPDSFKPW